jgi:Carboxypeptidase regulatory-like domain
MRHLCALLLFAVLEVWPAGPLPAQRSGIVGTVADTLGVMLSGVQVELSGTDYGSITNSRGEFRLTRVKPGPYTLTMRRIGFEAISMKIDVADGNPMDLDFELTPSVVRLATVAVKEKYSSEKLARVGFDYRQKTSGVAPSRFVTRSDIEKQNPTNLLQLLDRMGGRVRGCADAVVYVDGIAPGAQTDHGNPGAAQGVFRTGGALRPPPGRTENPSSHRYRLLENIPPRQVDGMEIYASTSEIPAEFRRGQFGDANGRCVVLIWTREQ